MIRRPQGETSVVGGTFVVAVVIASAALGVFAGQTRSGAAAVSATSIPTAALGAPTPGDVGGGVPLAASVRQPLTDKERRLLSSQSATAAKPATPGSTSTGSTSSVPPTSTTVVTTTTIILTTTLVPATTVAPTTSSIASTTTLTTLSTTTVAKTIRNDGGVLQQVVLGDGAFVFDPPVSVRPQSRKVDAVLRARQAVAKTVRKATPDVFFALFSSSSPEKRDPVTGSLVPMFDQRPVWVVHYRALESARAKPVVIASKSNPPTTILVVGPREPTTVRTDVVVVFDDKTGSQILRTEYASTDH